MNNKSLKKNWPYLLIPVLLVVIVASLAWAFAENKRADELSVDNISQQSTETQLQDHGIIPLDPTQASNSKTTADDLAYIIEEEKLAHDVYQAMYEKWGIRIFNNIQNSETTHQNMVFAVMESRSLADPRQSELGKFTDRDLQKLYDTLIAQGNQSQAEAYKVGVIIEETDIADLKKILGNLDAKDGDIKAVLENLLNGSENHLRAFNRQVTR